MPDFIHLRGFSSYSLLESALKIPDLAAYCQHYKMPAFGLCDKHNMCGAVEFSQAFTKAGLQPILGLTLQIALHDNENTSHHNGTDGAGLGLIAKDETGYRHLSALSTEYYLNGREPITLKRLCEAHQGLIVLTGGHDGLLNHLLQQNPDDAEQMLAQLKNAFGTRLYVELTRHGEPLEKKLEPKLLDIATAYRLPLVATNHCYYRGKNHHAGWRVLQNIGTGGHYTSDGNAGSDEYGEHYLKSPDEMQKLFADLPDALENTVHLAQRCNFLMQEQKPLLPTYHDLGVSDATNETSQTEGDYLIGLSEKGLASRLENYVFPRFAKNKQSELQKQYYDRLHYELGIIIDKGFVGYFLIVENFIRWAKQNNIPVGPSRGSGGGSLVAWTLDIIDLDPLRWGLLFERFLNPERVSMPDFDIDFCQDRRGEVINYVRETYGEEQVAQIITFGTLKPRACVRDVGRVMGLPYPVVDRISKLIPDFCSHIAPLLEDGKEKIEALQTMYREDSQIRILLDFSKQLEGLYRHASTHAAGVVIANQKLVDIVPLYHDGNAENLPATQFSMKYAEFAGLVKFDFLGLRTLTVLQKATQMIKQNHDVDVDINAIKLDEPEIYKMLAQGDSFGVFQFESSGMRDVLRNMQPDRLEDLIAGVALYRPGPMENIPIYNARKNGKAEVRYLHPLLEPVLKETYGIPVYQEQVMQMAEHLAGYSLGAADRLRRAMGKKIPEEMKAEREHFINGAAKHHNIGKAQAEQIFNEMDAFAGYGFNKSHAAGYAIVAYQTAWLKCFYPPEYYAAMLTYEMHSTDKIAHYRTQIEQQGILFLPPDINKSDAGFKAETDAANKDEKKIYLRYALAALKNAGGDVMNGIITERNKNGDYESLIDFAERNCDLRIGRRALETMCKAGVFDSLVAHRAQSFEAIPLMIAHAAACLAQRDSTQNNLFFDAQNANPPPPTLPEIEAWTHHEMLNHELDAVGFYISDHPLNPYGDILQRLNVLQAKDIDGKKGLVTLCGIPNSIRKINSRTGKRMAFVTFSDISGQFELTLFEEQINSHRDLLEGKAPLLIKAEIRYQTDMQGQEKMRLRFIELSLLDDGLAENIHQITLTCAEPKWLQMVSNILSNHGQKGSGKIMLKLPVGDKMVTLKLAEQYNLSPGLLNAFRSTPNIDVNSR